MHKKSTRKSAKPWDQSAERALLEIWDEMMPRLRGSRKNKHILADMVSELAKQGFKYTAMELKTKMHNLSSRYRREKRRMASGGSPTDWELYNDVDNLLGPFDGLPPGSSFTDSIDRSSSQFRWQSMRDRSARETENDHDSSSGAEEEEEEERPREDMKPRKRTIKRSKSPQPVQERKSNGRSKDTQSREFLEEDGSQSLESLEEASVLEAESIYLPEGKPTSRKKRKVQVDETFTKFLNKMTRMLETRTSTPAAKKEKGPHDGFFSMVQEIFDDLPDDVVRNAKFFFINYLHDEMIETKKVVFS